jgi:hypothetical protein
MSSGQLYHFSDLLWKILNSAMNKPGMSLKLYPKIKELVPDLELTGFFEYLLSGNKDKFSNLKQINLVKKQDNLLSKLLILGSRVGQSVYRVLQGLVLRLKSKSFQSAGSVWQIDLIHLGLFLESRI